MVADQRPGLIRLGGLVFLIIAMAASIALADFCPKCGKEIDATDNFCRGCGKNLKSSEEPKQEGNKEKGPEQRQSQHQQVVIVIQKDGKTCVKGDQEGKEKPPAPLYQATFSVHSDDRKKGLLGGKLSGRDEVVSLVASDGVTFDVTLFKPVQAGATTFYPAGDVRFSLDCRPPGGQEFAGQLSGGKVYTQALGSVDVQQNCGYRFVLRLHKREWALSSHTTLGEFRVYPDSVIIETEK